MTKPESMENFWENKSNSFLMAPTLLIVPSLPWRQSPKILNFLGNSASILWRTLHSNHNYVPIHGGRGQRRLGTVSGGDAVGFAQPWLGQAPRSWPKASSSQGTKLGCARLLLEFFSRPNTRRKKYLRVLHLRHFLDGLRVSVVTPCKQKPLHV